MATTRKMLDEAVGMGCGADGPFVQVGIDACKEPGPDARREACPSVLLHVNEDAYDGLRQATPEELLEAVAWFYRQESTISAAEAEEVIWLLRTGFQLARPGGWEHVAPMWLRESRKLAALDGS